MIVVLWTYYSALILLFGAEVTQVMAVRAGRAHLPGQKAVHISEHDRVQQGIPHQDTVASSNDSAPCVPDTPEGKDLAKRSPGADPPLET